MKKLLALIVWIGCTVSCFAQKELNEWYFGRGLGISFKNGAPVALNNGKLSSFEGCGSICDKNGNLLFYSDGQNVWNAQHTTMPRGTGLIGGAIGFALGNSSAQGVLIVPDPASTSRYYIFITPEIITGKTDKLCAYLVDMTLDNGLGDVLPELIELNLSSEKMTGTVDCEGTGFWIVTHDNLKNEFYSYHLSKSGLNRTPVVSTVGKPLPRDDYSVSCMKISPNGKMLVLPVRGNKNVELFNFNNSTGIVSTPRTIVNNVFAYGVSFSPNSEKLYINARSDYSSTDPTPLLQFTVKEIADEKEIADSKKIIDPSVNIGTMQIGPDKNIYLVEFAKNYVSAIVNPDDVNAKYIRQAVEFGGNSSGDTQYGLPNFIDNIGRSGRNGGEFTGSVQADKLEITPGETALVKLVLKSENIQQGISAFKASIAYEPKVFQFNENSIKFLKGASSSWQVKADQRDGILEIEAIGQKTVNEVEIAIEISAYLARQTNENILLTIKEIDGEEIQDGGCRTVTTQSTKLLLKKVCPGDLRLVEIGEFATAIQQVKPNPVTDESVEIEYSTGIEGNISLEIFNLKGQLVQAPFKGRQKAGVFKETLNIKELPAGVYLLKMTTLQGTQTQIFTVVK